jgi:hypothetical protein
MVKSARRAGATQSGQAGVVVTGAREGFQEFVLSSKPIASWLPSASSA